MSQIKAEMDKKGQICYFCKRWFPFNQVRQVGIIEHKNDIGSDFICIECDEADRRDFES